MHLKDIIVLNISMSLKIGEIAMHSAKETARKDALLNTHITIINRNLGHMRKRSRVLCEKLQRINKAVLWQRPLCAQHALFEGI